MALTLSRIWKWRKAPWGNSFRPTTMLEMIEMARGKISGANFQWNKKRKIVKHARSSTGGAVRS